MTACIDLRTLAGKRYRLGRDEAATHEPGGRDDPWMFLLRGKYGHVFPWGGDKLAVSVDGRRGIARAIRGLPFASVVQDGDEGELTATFPAEHLDEVAGVVRLYRRVQLSDAERERRRERGLALASNKKRGLGVRPAVQTA